MKAGWEVKPLEKCIEPFRISGKIPRKKFQTEGPYPIVSQEADFINGYWADDSDLNRVTKPLVIFGDHTQVIKYVDFDFVVGADGVKILQPIDELNARFFAYFLEGHPIPSLGYARHFRHIKALKVPIPPLNEQKRIVAVLDAAFEGLTRAKENATANLQNARELFEAQVMEQFLRLENDFGKRKICEIADHRLGKMLDKNKNRGVLRAYLRNKNVQWFDIDSTDLLEMKIKDDEVEKYSVKQGDLLICEGGYPGRAAIWSDEKPIFYQKALHRVRFEEPIYNRLLLYWLYLLDQTGKLSAYCSGAGILHFTGESLAKFEMPFPSPELAANAVSAIEGTKQQSETLAANYRTKLTDIADLRQSLLQKAFAGELT